MWRIFAASILLQLCQAGEKGRKSLNKGGKDVSQSYFATNISFFWPLEATYQGEWGQKLKFGCAVICPYFFKFLKAPCNKLSLGCNASHFLIIFSKKLIKNTYNANKNLKKLHLEAKISNFRMALVRGRFLYRIVLNNVYR